ncbi:MAG: STAS domain-containing protein [Deltaproteobacteria bacterium]|nr:STAS domain-containing protein [Deltaproteobacteria bacterium]
MADRSKLGEILVKYESELLEHWMKEQLAAVTLRRDLMSEHELRQQSVEFVRLFRQGVARRNFTDINSQDWAPLREMLASVSKSRALHGFSPSETAIFVFSFKQPLLERLRKEHGNDADSLAQDVWIATVVLDQLGLYTTEVYQQSREQVIARQQSDLLELSTPVVQLWPGILCIPLIGTLDSERTQVVMESLLQRISETGSQIAIIDISGVPAVDTLVAQHLLKTVSAARLMGADCLVSGIRPQIAQTVVHLGVKLSDVTTKATLAAALDVALRSLGLEVKNRQK